MIHRGSPCKPDDFVTNLPFSCPFLRPCVGSVIRPNSLRRGLEFQPHRVLRGLAHGSERRVFEKTRSRPASAAAAFLKTAGVSSLATAVTSVGVAEVEAQTGPAVI